MVKEIKITLPWLELLSFTLIQFAHSQRKNSTEVTLPPPPPPPPSSYKQTEIQTLNFWLSFCNGCKSESNNSTNFGRYSSEPLLTMFNSPNRLTLTARCLGGSPDRLQADREQADAKSKERRQVRLLGKR